MPATPESKIKKGIKAYLRSIGAAVFPLPGGAYGCNGAPDILACYKGKFIAIEGKANDGVQSSWQKLRQRQIEEAEGIYILAWSVEDVRRVLSSLNLFSAKAEN
jgi:Holliday junction resolvase